MASGETDIGREYCYVASSEWSPDTGQIKRSQRLVHTDLEGETDMLVTKPGGEIAVLHTRKFTEVAQRNKLHEYAASPDGLMVQRIRVDADLRATN